MDQINDEKADLWNCKRAGLQVEMTVRPIEVDKLVCAVGHPAHGATAMFLGVVRNRNQGREVKAVNYEAHVPLTLRVFDEICVEAKARWGDGLNVVLSHRLGQLNVGEASVLIAVSTPHRAEAFDASRYIIEELKRRAPIWKKEYYHDGESEWLRGHALCSHGADRGDSGGRSVQANGDL